MRSGEGSRRFLTILIIILVVFFAARNDSKSVLNMLFVNVLSPVQTQITNLGNWVGSKKDYLASMSNVYEENQSLKNEIQELNSKNIYTGEVWAENQRLKGLLNYKQDNPRLNLVAAKIIGISPGRTRTEIIINRGRAQGLKENMPVVAANGLVGTVSMLYDNSAKVSLLSHMESAVGGVVQRSASRAVGIVNGEVVDDNYLKFAKLQRDADVQVGDMIITSGLGGVYPKGIIIGEVIKVANEDTGLLKYAVVKPRVDFSNLEEVLVLTNAAPGMDATPTSVVARMQKDAADAAAKAAQDAQAAQQQQRQQQQQRVTVPAAQQPVQVPTANVQPTTVVPNAVNSGVVR